MNRVLSVALVLAGGATLLAGAGNPVGPGGGGGQALIPAEEEGLLFMREEEKLSRDVYLYFDGLYELPIFGNIAASEQRHMDAVLTLLVRYGLEDPAADKEPGEFTDPTLQALYDELIAKGADTLEGALGAGVTVEETDIADLEQRLEDVVHDDIRGVYRNLLRGSQNHLAAFQSHLGGGADSNGVAARRGSGRQPGTGCGRLGGGNGSCHGQHEAAHGQFGRKNGRGGGQRNAACGRLDQGNGSCHGQRQAAHGQFGRKNGRCDGQRKSAHRRLGRGNGRCGGQCETARGRLGQGIGRCDGSCLGDGKHVTGVVDSIDAVEQQVVVGDVTVRISGDTILRQQGRTITFADLATGQTIAACGVLEDGVLIATRVTVRHGGN